MAKFIETGELREGGMGSEGWTGMKLQEEEKVLERTVVMLDPPPESPEHH